MCSQHFLIYREQNTLPQRKTNIKQKKSQFKKLCDNRKHQRKVKSKSRTQNGGETAYVIRAMTFTLGDDVGAQALPYAPSAPHATSDAPTAALISASIGLGVWGRMQLGSSGALLACLRASSRKWGFGKYTA